MAEKLAEGQVVQRGDAGKFEEGGSLSPERARMLSELSQESRAQGSKEAKRLGQLLTEARKGNADAAEEAISIIDMAVARAIVGNKAKISEWGALSSVLRDAIRPPTAPRRGEVCQVCGHLAGAEIRTVYVELSDPPQDRQPWDVLVDRGTVRAIDGVMNGIRNRREDPDWQE